MKSITALLGISIVLLSLFDYYGLISKKYCSVTCLQNFDGIGFNWFLLLLIAFFFSFSLGITSKSLHQRWWKFARIALPIILLIATIINMRFHHSNYGFFNMDSIFDIPALASLYVVFITGSLIQILSGYTSK